MDLSSIKKAISRLLIVGFDGSSVRESHDLQYLQQEDSLGGLVHFDLDVSSISSKDSKNIINPIQVASLNYELRQMFPLGLRSVDAEGGLDWIIQNGNKIRLGVNRLKPKYGFVETMDAASIGGLYRTGNLSAIKKHCDIIAGMIASAGFNCVYAPVVDLNINKECPIIGAMNRSYGDSIDEVVGCANIFIDACHGVGVQTVLKHYPGHGSSVGDTHLGCVDVSNTWSSCELEPFYALADKCGMVMMSHVIARQVDSVPASLSAKWIAKLRDSGFDGVVVSDDIQMQAIYALGVGENELEILTNIIIQALSAGNDMVIVGQQQNALPMSKWDDLLSKLADAVVSGRLCADKLRYSTKRIENMHAVFAN